MRLRHHIGPSILGLQHCETPKVKSSILVITVSILHLAVSEIIALTEDKELSWCAWMFHYSKPVLCPVVSPEELADSLQPICESLICNISASLFAPNKAEGSICGHLQLFLLAQEPRE